MDRKRKAEQIAHEDGGEPVAADGDDSITLDQAGLRRLMLAFEKSINKNLEERIKYAGEPAKFVSSELELADLLQRLHALAASPELYSDFVSSVPSLLQLLTHDNTDIAIEAIDLIKELTEPDNFQESESAIRLVEAMIASELPDLLITCTKRLDEIVTTSPADASTEDESKGIFEALGIFENLMELNPAIIDQFMAPPFSSSSSILSSSLLPFLLKGINSSSTSELTDVTCYCAEILAMFLQPSAACRTQFFKVGGVSSLLKIIKFYLSRDPKSLDEQEFVENIFDSLCSSLLLPDNQNAFKSADGFSILFAMIKERSYTRSASFKAIDFALLRNVSNATEFVEKRGLAVLFPALMKLGTAKTEKQAAKEKEDIERIMSITASLLMLLPNGSPQRGRVMTKFVENSYEKSVKLIDLLQFHFVKMVQFERQYQQEHEDDEEDEEDLEEKRIENGLLVLQHLAYIVATVYHEGGADARTSIDELLSVLSLSKKNVLSVLEEFAENVGEEAKREMRLDWLMKTLSK